MIFSLSSSFIENSTWAAIRSSNCGRAIEVHRHCWSRQQQLCSCPRVSRRWAVVSPPALASLQMMNLGFSVFSSIHSFKIRCPSTRFLIYIKLISNVTASKAFPRWFASDVFPVPGFPLIKMLIIGRSIIWWSIAHFEVRNSMFRPSRVLCSDRPEFSGQCCSSYECYVNHGWRFKRFIILFSRSIHIIMIENPGLVTKFCHLNSNLTFTWKKEFS